MSPFQIRAITRSKTPSVLSSLHATGYRNLLHTESLAHPRVSPQLLPPQKDFHWLSSTQDPPSSPPLAQRLSPPSACLSYHLLLAVIGWSAGEPVHSLLSLKLSTFSILLTARVPYPAWYTADYLPMNNY